MKQEECEAKSQKKADKRKRKRERQRQKAKAGGNPKGAHDDDDDDEEDNEAEDGGGKKPASVATSSGAIDPYRATVQLKSDGTFLEKMKEMLGSNITSNGGDEETHT